jgi:GTP cyclohydrolase II
MSKPKAGSVVELEDKGKKIKVKVYRVNDTHVTVEMNDKKLWTMTLRDYNEKLNGSSWWG